MCIGVCTNSVRRATEAYEGARQRVARYLNAASADEIVFTRGTTESINLVAQAWGGKFIRTDDVILLTEMEHHSNLVPWQLLAERTGARLRFVPVREGWHARARSASPVAHAGGETVRLHTRFQFVRHDQFRGRSLPAGPRGRPRLPWLMPPRAPGTCCSMCRNWVAIFSLSPVTRCVAPRQSARSTVEPQFWKRCRPGTEAAK